MHYYQVCCKIVTASFQPVWALPLNNCVRGLVCRLSILQLYVWLDPTFYQLPEAAERLFLQTGAHSDPLFKSTC